MVEPYRPRDRYRVVNLSVFLERINGTCGSAQGVGFARPGFWAARTAIRNALGEYPVTRLKALLKALSVVYPSDWAIAATEMSCSRNARSANRMRHSVRYVSGAIPAIALK